MNFLLSFLSVMLSCLTPSSEKDLGSVAAGHKISFEYTYEASDEGSSYTGTGSVVYQEGAYKVVYDGLKVYCDGKTMWTVSSTLKEVAIDAGVPIDLSKDPMEVASLIGFSPDGAKVSTTWSSDGTPSTISISLKSGTEVKLRIKSFKLHEKGPLSEFSFNPSSLDKSWTVSDMR